MDNTDQPKDFGAALTMVLNEGELEIQAAIKEAMERYPELYQRYEAEILDPLYEQNL